MLKSQISIHSPYAGGDLKDLHLINASLIFQSTPPMQGETLPSNICFKCRAISIHSPYAGGDVRKVKATDNKKISIHSPYAGGDIRNRCLNAVFENFNPLPLCRGRHSALSKDDRQTYISIQPPYAGGDLHHTTSA